MSPLDGGIRATHMLYWLASRGVILRGNERRLLSLRNSLAGRRAFVLGNGPSLAQVDLDTLSGELTIGSNALFLAYQRTTFRPTFYTVEDRLFAEDRGVELSSRAESIKIIPEDLRYAIPGDDGTIWINFVRRYPDFPRFSNDFASRVYWGGTVSFLNLQLAWYLGSREVYLLGFDHDYTEPSRNDQVEGNIVTSAGPDPNHFDPGYFGPGRRWHIPRVERMERAYVEAARAFDQGGGRIYNATAGGRLELFERVDLGDVLSRS